MCDEDLADLHEVEDDLQSLKLDADPRSGGHDVAQVSLAPFLEGVRSHRKVIGSHHYRAIEPAGHLAHSGRKVHGSVLGDGYRYQSALPEQTPLLVGEVVRRQHVGRSACFDQAGPIAVNDLEQL